MLRSRSWTFGSKLTNLIRTLRSSLPGKTAMYAYWLTTLQLSDKRKCLKDVQLIKESGLFDEEYYLDCYPELGFSLVDPIEHYVMSGANEGRNPAKNFDTSVYVREHPEVEQSKINPLVHYIKSGT